MQSTINLKQEHAINDTQPPAQSRKRKAIKWLAWSVIKCSVVVVVAFGIVTGAKEAGTQVSAIWQDFYTAAMKRLTKVEIVREFVQPMALPPEQLVEKYSKELKVPKII